VPFAGKTSFSPAQHDASASERGHNNPLGVMFVVVCSWFASRRLLSGRLCVTIFLSFGVSGTSGFAMSVFLFFCFPFSKPLLVFSLFFWCSFCH